jgi:predicted AlkP superfamily pyrophosphatase or phosphodiesterase
MRRFGLYLAGLLIAAPASAAPVLMISIDGLRARDVIDAPARGLKLPNLRAMMKDGSYAEGVRDVLPSVTYPNHTTLITGVAPALHGIADNLAFDPQQKNMEGWYWYSSDIKVPTLWDAVKAKGGLVANYGWPVSVGSSSIADNIPEYWRTYMPDDLKLLRALSSPGLVARIEKASGVSFAATNGVTAAADDARAKFMAALIAADHPAFTTVHLASLDETQHEKGPGTPEAKANLESLDKSVGELVTAARKAEPGLVVALVSDHGFAPVHNDVNLMPAFIAAGLATLDPKTGKIGSWQAEPWYAGGSSIIMLAHPDDTAVRAKVAALLKKLAADPANGIAAVIDRREIARQGGSTLASFWVDYAFGFEAGKKLTGPLVGPPANLGTHGYFPAHPEMRSSFLITGPGIAAGKSLGEIDMRDIAPTLAKIMDVSLPSATGKPLF